MDEAVSRLVHLMFYPLVPSPEFIASLSKYLRPSPSPCISIELLLQDRFPDALPLYSRLVPNSVNRTLVYTFILLRSDSVSISDTLRVELKRGALGFKVPYFSPSELIILKDRLPFCQHFLISRIYTHSLMYKQLKSAVAFPVSGTHKYFLEFVCNFLHEYEQAVLGSSCNILQFNNNLYNIFINLEQLININDIICNKTYIKDGTIYNKVLNIDGFNFKLKSIFYKVINECTKEYLINGTFNDIYDEYFIKNNSLIVERVPYGLSYETVNKILYIGKYTCLLGSIGLLEINEDIQQMIGMLDLSSKSHTNKINEILKSANRVLFTKFIKKYLIAEFMEYIHDVFLFRRGDFIEYFFNSLKNARKFSCKASRPSNKNHLLSILEDSLFVSFLDSPFNSSVDIYIKQSEGTNGRERSMDSFSLFCHVEYPITIILDEGFVLKLACIFKFLWKLKRVDILSRRIGNIWYVNLMQRIMFYMFNEVIGLFSFFEWDEEGLAIDNLHERVNEKLDKIMKGLFINTPEKKMEFLIYYLEKAMVNAGKNGELCDAEVQRALREFYTYARDDIEGTSLADIFMFIKV